VLRPLGHSGGVVMCLHRSAPNMDPVDLDRAVADHLPEEWLKAVVKSIFLAKRLSHDHCKAEFSATAAINVSNFYERGKVQDLLYGSAELMPGFGAEFKDASGWKHAKITAGPFTITAHPVASPCALVDDAEYRRTLAESQPSLYDPADMIPGAKLYGLIVHSPYRGRSTREAAEYAYVPGSIYLAFPEAALKSYAHQINLFEKFPELIENLLPQEWDKRARVIYRWQAQQIQARPNRTA